jgi:DGQHR domain-containing protein
MTAQISFPVLPGNQANQKYYLGNVEVKALLPFVEIANESLPPHESYQRHLDPKRVKKCAEFILTRTPSGEDVPQLTKWSLPPILVALSDGGFTFDSEKNLLHLDMGSPLAILDGQHRCAALKQIKSMVAASRPSSGLHYQWELIKESTIGVMFYDAPTLKERQNIFSMVNSNAKKTDKSNDLVNSADTDPIASFCRSLVAGTSKRPAMFPYAAYEANSPSVSAKGDKLFTFAQLHKMVSLARPQFVSDLKAREYLRKFMGALADAVEPYRLAAEYFQGGQADSDVGNDDEMSITPGYIIGHFNTHLKVVTEAFGYLGGSIHYAYKEINPEVLKGAFKDINWELGDPFFDCIKNPKTGKVKGIKANKLALAEKLFGLYKAELEKVDPTKLNWKP